MGKKKGKKSKGIALVPGTADMDDETFLKHLEKRHSHETGVEKNMHRNAMEAWVPVYRAWHHRQHRVAEDDEFAEQYDHEHDWDTYEEDQDD